MPHRFAQQSIPRVDTESFAAHDLARLPVVRIKGHGVNCSLTVDQQPDRPGHRATLAGFGRRDQVQPGPLLGERLRCGPPGDPVRPSAGLLAEPDAGRLQPGEASVFLQQVRARGHQVRLRNLHCGLRPALRRRVIPHARRHGQAVVPPESHRRWVAYRDPGHMLDRDRLLVAGEQVGGHLAGAAQLRFAWRALQRAEAEMRSAELDAKTIDVELRALYAEARAVGLVPDEDITDPILLIRRLHGARIARQPDQRAPTVGDVARQDRYMALESRAQTLRSDLQRILADRALLLDERNGESDYEQSMQLQVGRLDSLNLIGFAADQVTSSVSACPACGQPTQEEDPTPTALRTSLNRLRSQLENLAAARPSQRNALVSLDTQAAALREELAGAEAALNALRAADRVTELTAADNTDFTRGRIDAILPRVDSVDEQRLRRLRATVDSAAATVEALETELNDDEDREQLTSRLLIVGQDMSAYADRLELEHSEGGSIRLDLARLTVVADTERGPIPLERIGSAANWIGYHLATHLALHKHLTRQNRPVPRFLLLDQPTQAHYPSEVSLQSGIPENDADREAVRRLFRLLYDVVRELRPEFQVIVCDHANLPEPWFQDSVVQNWRGGRKLIPEDWLD
jgi:hypothetical protein